MGVEKLLKKIIRNPRDVRFNDLDKLCSNYFGAARQSKSSHRVYKTPWRGDPRVNIQRSKDGTAKYYQVKQVLAAIRKL